MEQLKSDLRYRGIKLYETSTRFMDWDGKDLLVVASKRLGRGRTRKSKSSTVKRDVQEHGISVSRRGKVLCSADREQQDTLMHWNHWHAQAYLSVDPPEMPNKDRRHQEGPVMTCDTNR